VFICFSLHRLKHGSCRCILISMGKQIILYICSLQSDRPCSPKDRGRESSSDNHCTILDNTAMVANIVEFSKGSLLPSTKTAQNTQARTQTRNKVSSDKNSVNCFQYIQEALRLQGLSEDAQNRIIKSWRESTRNQYNTYLKNGFVTANGRQIPVRPLHRQL